MSVCNASIEAACFDLLAAEPSHHSSVDARLSGSTSPLAHAPQRQLWIMEWLL